MARWVIYTLMVVLAVGTVAFPAFHAFHQAFVQVNAALER